MKTVLIDDEKLALQYLQHQLESIGNTKIIGAFTNPYEAIDFLREVEVDIVFLDIQMPGINGLEVAEQILNHKPDANIVFVTAYEDYVIKAFEINALDYVLKPVKQERLKNTLSRITAKEKKPASDEGLFIYLFKELKFLKVPGFAEKLKWRTSKAEQMFLYIIHNKDRYVHSGELIELLWGDTSLEKGQQQLYIAVYQIRQALADYRDHILIQSDKSGYGLKLTDVVFDVDEFLKIAKSKDKVNKDTVEAYEHVIDLAKGEYLAIYDYNWCLLDRENFNMMWMDVANKLITWYIKEGRLNDGIILCKESIEKFPLEEETYFNLMKLYALKKDSQGVEDTYKKLEATLDEELDASPDYDIEEWYNGWMQG